MPSEREFNLEAVRTDGWFERIGEGIDDSGGEEWIAGHTVVARIEDVVIREYQKGGTAASVKDAVERVVNQIRAKSRQLGAEARSVKTDSRRLREE